MLQHFKALELSENVSWEEVRAAYKDLVRVWHPDRFQGDAELKARAEKKTREINLSYQELKKYFSARGVWEGASGEPPAKESNKVSPSDNSKNEWARAEKRRAARKDKSSRGSKSQNSYNSTPTGKALSTLKWMYDATLQTLVLLVSPGFILSIWIFVVVIARPSPERVSSFVKAQSSYMSERIIHTIRVFSRVKTDL